MMQMRWFESCGVKTLQYRQKIDMTVRAGLNWTPDQLASTANYQWTEWTDVPTVVDPAKLPITAESVQYLREISDCSMMQCKKALTACGGDMAKAAEWLRTNRGFYV